MKNDLVLFTDGNIQLEVPVSQDGESVWLSANQMAVLFDKDETNIRKHINNVFKSTEVDKDNNTQNMRVVGENTNYNHIFISIHYYKTK